MKSMLRGNFEYLIEKSNWTTNEESIIHNLEKTDRVYFAERIKNYDGILIDLSYDKDKEVRLGVAKNASTPIQVLKRLENDQCSEVSLAAKTTLRGCNIE